MTDVANNTARVPEETQQEAKGKSEKGVKGQPEAQAPAPSPLRAEYGERRLAASVTYTTPDFQAVKYEESVTVTLSGGTPEQRKDALEKARKNLWARVEWEAGEAYKRIAGEEPEQ